MLVLLLSLKEPTRPASSGPKTHQRFYYVIRHVISRYIHDIQPSPASGCAAEGFYPLLAGRKRFE